MAYEIVMPRLSWTMEEGTFVEWLKRDGDAVKMGDILFTAESDKAVNEVEALETGILRIPPDAPTPGTVLKVGTLLAYIVAPGEPAPFEQQSSLPRPSTASAAAVPAAPAQGRSNQSDGRRSPAISPRARRIAAELGVDWSVLKGSGRTGRIVERDVRAAAAQLNRIHPSPAHTPQAAAVEPAVRISPLARRVAEELEVDLEQLSKSAPGKRIARADVEAAAQAASAAPSQAGRDEQFVPITTVRRITAERMAASAHTTAPVTLTMEVDATELVTLRRQLKADSERSKRTVPTYNDLLVRLCAEALADHPSVNARFSDDGSAIIVSRAVHIGIATDTDRGLLVPVLRDVQGRSLRQIAEESAALIQRARAGQLKPDEMHGGTFTITNLGMFGIDAFTPIINLPECAILGVGRIVPKQVVIDAEAEKLAIRHMMFLSLTFDHRLIDGAQAARFLQRVRQYIEQPYLWLA